MTSGPKSPFSLNSPYLFSTISKPPLLQVIETAVKKCSQLFIMRWTGTTGAVSGVGINLTLMYIVHQNIVARTSANAVSGVGINLLSAI